MKKSGKFFPVLTVVLLTAGCISYENIKQQADNGDPVMQYQVSQMLFKGDGVARNESEAEKYLMKSLEAGNLSAACFTAKRILRRKKGDESETLMKAYVVIFSRSPRDNSEYSAVIDRRRNYPGDVIRYVKYLNDAGLWKSGVRFRKFAFQYLEQGKCLVPDHIIENARKQLEGMKTQQEIDEETRIAEEKRNSPDFKFPMRKISDKRVEILKGFPSGVSFQWAVKNFVLAILEDYSKELEGYSERMKKYEKGGDKANARYMQNCIEDHRKKMKDTDGLLEKVISGCHSFSEEFDGFYFIFKKHHYLYFSCGQPAAKKNMNTSVLVKRVVALPNISHARAEKSILEKNPGAKVKRYKRTETSKFDKGSCVHVVDTTTYTTEIENASVRWIIAHSVNVSRWEASNYVRKQLELKDGESYTGGTVVSTIDKKLYDAFVKMKSDAAARKKQAEEKARREQAAKELDSI